MTKEDGLRDKIYRDKIIEEVEKLANCNFDDLAMTERIDLMAYVTSSVIADINNQPQGKY